MYSNALDSQTLGIVLLIHSISESIGDRWSTRYPLVNHVPFGTYLNIMVRSTMAPSWVLFCEHKSVCMASSNRPLV